MKRAMSLLKFSSPARALNKFTSPAMTGARPTSRSRFAPPRNTDPFRPFELPGSFVTLSCADRSSTEAYVLRYAADGRKVHNIAFGPRQAYRMTNSCDGLVGIYGFWITNPSIPRVAGLPGCSPHFCTFRLRGTYRTDRNILGYDMPHAAIGLADASTREHKVVRIFVREWTWYHPISLGCEVLSLEKENQCFWKQVDDPPTYSIAMFSTPIVVDGIMYWMVTRTPGSWMAKPSRTRSKFRRSVVALCFNLQEEKFSLLHHPEGWTRGRIAMSNLFLLEGRPCILGAYEQDGWATVWSLEDRVNSKWIRRGHFFRDGCPHNSSDGRLFSRWREYYDIPTMDYDDEETVRLLGNKTFDNVREYFMYRIFDGSFKYSYLMDYRASYTDCNFWPF